MIIILTGVSGCGKTTIGKLLATKLNAPFYDADDFHPDINIQKMSNNEALSDEDRLPWLTLLAENIKFWNSQGNAILACSALKESYRKILMPIGINIKWVFLKGEFDLINQRLNQRTNHYMKSGLLKSQFEDLEVPNYAFTIDINNNPDFIVNQIMSNVQHNQKSSIGVFGLGVMGKSLSLNLAKNGFIVSVYNRIALGEEKVVSKFLESNRKYENIFGFTELEGFIQSIETPRKILIMIQAGSVIDEVLEQLIPLLSKEDIIMDGGNSYYLNTNKRNKFLKKYQINFIGCGISGGEEGALKGPSLMPGGNEKSYQEIAPILNKIAAVDKKNNPCCSYIGREGAGHFVKMVHNGIEYAEMQLIAEVYTFLKSSKDNLEIARILSKWNSQDLSSYLLEITVNILKRKRGNEFVLDAILDAAGNKGTGSWSSNAALNLGTVNTMMTSAVFMRYISSFKEKRIQLSGLINHKVQKEKSLNIKSLKKAYRFARIINHHQGFELMQMASKEYNWNLNLSEIARIWTNGCIIRSGFMETLVDILKKHDSCLDDQILLNILVKSERGITKCISASLNNRIVFDSFYAAYNYWIAMTTKNLSANLIQAQRDYFGAHMFQFTNDSSKKYHHINWLEND
jgi:6-phosphogluconate dehydrogenase